MDQDLDPQGGRGGGGSQLSFPDLIAQPRGEIRHLVLNTADPVFQLVAGGLQVWAQNRFLNHFLEILIILNKLSTLQKGRVRNLKNI